MSSEIRLTPTSYIVLGLIEAAGEATPYDLKQAVSLSLGNFWSLPHAQLYAEPERLAAAGLLSERREVGGRRRKHYALTTVGRRALRDWLAEPTDELTELRDLSMLKIFFGADPKAMATVQLPARQRRVAEYEEIVARIDGHVPKGIVLALEAGIAHEQEWVRFWTRLQAGEEEI
ncbi:MAG: PadR family transcriptional regulator [Solirubrobacterales bacterium]